MKARSRIALAGLLLVPGCGGGGGGSSSLNITGGWHGVYSLDNGDAGNFVIAPNQNGQSVRGFAEFSNCSCLDGGMLGGEVLGHRFVGHFGGPSVPIEAVVSGPTDDAMHGTVEILDGPCAGVEGTFTVARDP
jgi:hypothetical protein